MNVASTGDSITLHGNSLRSRFKDLIWVDSFMTKEESEECIDVYVEPLKDNCEHFYQYSLQASLN